MGRSVTPDVRPATHLVLGISLTTIGVVMITLAGWANFNKAKAHADAPALKCRVFKGPRGHGKIFQCAIGKNYFCFIGDDQTMSCVRRIK